MFTNVERYVWIGLSLLCVWIGWQSSYDYHAVKQLKVDAVQSAKDLEQRDKVIATTNQNIKQLDDQANDLHNQLAVIQINYEIKAKENEDIKDKLNRTNHVNMLLVRSMGASNTRPTGVSKNGAVTSGNVNESTAYVPADRVADWALGLKQAYENCAAVHNATIRTYNQQLILINGDK